MPDTKISALPAASVALATDQIPVNELGVTKRLTVAQIIALASATWVVQASDPVSPADNTAWVLSDGATFVALRAKLPGLAVLDIVRRSL